MSWLRNGLLVLALSIPTTLQAQAKCFDRDDLVEKLSAKYGEAFAGGGLQNQTSIVEVWFSPEQGTWTVLMTRADGKSCIMASGTNWRDPGDVKVPAGIPG
ncbi:MAG: hypothetical protein ACU0GG_18210 [Paracoccaceae bacterium]